MRQDRQKPLAPAHYLRHNNSHTRGRILYLRNARSLSQRSGPPYSPLLFIRGLVLEHLSALLKKVGEYWVLESWQASSYHWAPVRGQAFHGAEYVMLDTILEHALKEAKVIKEAPLGFVIVVALAGTLIFLVTQWHFSGLLDTLNSRISWQDDQLTDYRNRLHGASPEQAASQITALTKANTKLQDEIAALQRISHAPHLTKRQQSELKTVLGAGPDIKSTTLDRQLSRML